jgi:hypothetical protein
MKCVSALLESFIPEAKITKQRVEGGADENHEIMKLQIDSFDTTRALLRTSPMAFISGAHSK